MDGKRHLTIGAGVGVVTAAAVAYVDPQLGKDLGVTSMLGRTIMCAVLSPLAGMVISQERMKGIFALNKTVEKITKTSTGLFSSILLFVILLGLTFTEFGTIAVYSILGGVIGSLIPDLDSCHSTVNKYVNNLIMAGVVILGAGYILKIESITSLLRGNSHQVFIIAFFVLCILGKMSPHREFTHKILGATLFCICAWMIFPTLFALSFTLGFISHMIADKLPKYNKPLAIERYNPFALSFPCQKRNGKISIEDGIKHLFKSSKVH